MRRAHTHRKMLPTPMRAPSGTGVFRGRLRCSATSSSRPTGRTTSIRLSTVSSTRRCFAKPDEIVVTIGAQQALYLVADLLANESTTVGFENPGYPDARNIFLTRNARLLPLAVDGGGVRTDEDRDVLAQCDYVYVTPSHQCPTSVTMPIERRRALLKLAQRHDFVVIEDDYESENNFTGAPHPALKSLDTADRVIYIGSLSKTFAPGLRLGYVVGPRDLIHELRALRRLMVRHPAALIQRAFANFLALGHHDTLLRKLAHAY